MCYCDGFTALISAGGTIYGGLMTNGERGEDGDRGVKITRGVGPGPWR